MWGIKTLAAQTSFAVGDWLSCDPASQLLSFFHIGHFLYHPSLPIGQVWRAMSSYWLNIVALARG